MDDALPQAVLDQWEPRLKAFPYLQREPERRTKIAAYLDTGHGACWLKNQLVAKIVEDTFLRYDGAHYQLLEWVIMPNHVHVLVEHWEGCWLEQVVQSWKTRSEKRANAALHREGPFWDREYFEREISDLENFEWARNDIRGNPVKAKLCRSASDWRWSSAWGGRDPGKVTHASD